MERKILGLFLYNHKLKFSEIEKSLNQRSNKIAYHIKQLIKKEILMKQKDFYSLTKKSEYLIPYLSEKQHPLPVILIHIGDSKKAFLYKRGKRPFKDKLSLPGGRLLTNESISKSVKRIMRQKFNINAKLEKIKSISLEKVKKSNKTIHSFLLIFITAKTKDKLKLLSIEKTRTKIISSDYHLIKSKDSEIKFKTLISKT